MSKSPACFSEEKLQWTNLHYLKTMSEDALVPLLQEQFSRLGVDTENGPALVDFLLMQRERCKDMVKMAQKSRYFYEEVTSYDEKAATKQLKPKAIEPLTALSQRLRQLPEWNTVFIQKAVNETLGEFELKLGKLAQPLRVALTGSSASPSIDVTLYFIGRERTLSRIDHALVFLNAVVTGE